MIAPSQLLSKRPDVKSAELALKAANARVGISKASLYPSLTITAAGGVNAFELSNWFTIPASLFGSVAGGLTAPLLNSKRLKTQYEIAKFFPSSRHIPYGALYEFLVSTKKMKWRPHL